MGSNGIVKERLDTVYKDASIWEQLWEGADFTKAKIGSGKEIKTVDLTGCEGFEELENSYNYRWHFERLKNGLEREPTISDYYSLYIQLLADLNDFLIQNMYSLIYGDDSKLRIEGLKDATISDIVNAHDKETLKLELVFNEYTENLETSVDMAISDFPKNNLTEKEKNILNYLADNYHIKRKLTHNGLLPLFEKKGTKRLLRDFYKCAPEYEDFQAFNFIKSNIETNLPDATVQNYCREVKKDMPLKKRINSYNSV